MSKKFVLSMGLGIIMLCEVGSAQPPVVFPLQAGDWWLYRSFVTGTNEVSSVLSDTSMPNGLTYKRVTVPHFGSQFLRSSGNQVFRYWGPSNGDLLWFDFNRSVGHTIAKVPPWLGSDSGSIILTSKGIDTLFGRSRRYWSCSAPLFSSGYELSAVAEVLMFEFHGRLIAQS